MTLELAWLRPFNEMTHAAGMALRTESRCLWHPLPNTTLFGVLLCLPTATELPMWGPETSVRRRFSCSSRTSRCLPVSDYLGCWNVKHNGGSRKLRAADLMMAWSGIGRR